MLFIEGQVPPNGQTPVKTSLYAKYPEKTMPKIEMPRMIFSAVVDSIDISCRACF